jgi:transcriptional regulator with XRE-family HTH domain
MIELIYRQIGAAIKERRQSLGITQTELGTLIGLSRTATTNIELGRQRICVHTLYNIARALNTAPALLAPKPRVIARDVIYLQNDQRWKRRQHT